MDDDRRPLPPPPEGVKPHPRRAGDGWVECTCGRRHWGKFGSAGVLAYDSQRGVMLQHRVEWTHQGGTWGIPGGAIDVGESALQGALRETEEESGVPSENLTPRVMMVEDHGPWRYSTVIADVFGSVQPYAADAESEEVSFVSIDKVTDRPLLPSFGKAWPTLQSLLGRRVSLVIDAANAVGSKPFAFEKKGWWTNRTRATQKFLQHVSELTREGISARVLGLPADVWWPDVCVVLEGQSKKVADEFSSTQGVGEQRFTVVAASGEGDDEVVRQVEQAIAARGGTSDGLVIAVSADRELQRRVEAAGGRFISPSVLWTE